MPGSSRNRQRLESGAAPTVRPEGSTVPESNKENSNEATDGRIAEDDHVLMVLAGI